MTQLVLKATWTYFHIHLPFTSLFSNFKDHVKFLTILTSAKIPWKFVYILTICNLTNYFSRFCIFKLVNKTSHVYFDRSWLWNDFNLVLADMIPRSKSTLWAIFAVLAICVPSVYSLAVMSVDLGTEWMKVAVVSVSTFWPLVPTAVLVIHVLLLVFLFLGL